MTNQDEREERSDRLRERFGDKTAGDENPTDESRSKPSKTDTSRESDNSSSARSDEAVKDRPSVLMYLPEEIRQELDIRFDELNAQHKRQYGEALEKNRDYYPAVVEAGLTDKDLKEILDI